MGINKALQIMLNKIASEEDINPLLQLLPSRNAHYLGGCG
jgi:hypothetical protein